MPVAIIVVFMLFFAVLAFAWFYLQRAKARDAAAPADVAAGSVAATESAPPASAEPAPVASMDTAEHVHTADDEHDHPH
jgi:hypothetical protein